MKVLRAALAAMQRGQKAALVTVIGVAGSTPRSGGSRMLVHSDGSIVGTVGGGAFEHRVIQQAIDAIRDGIPRRFAVHLTHDLGMCCGGAMETYIEPLETQTDLIIYGAGHVGRATAWAASTAGFRCTVVDERDEFLQEDDFPESATLIAGDPVPSLDGMPWGPTAYHLIVTHDHSLDQRLVESILPRQSGWIGMIGSRAKVAKFFIRMRASGMNEKLFTKLSAPVGLDIGAETPEEIAISIVAEIIRVRRFAQQPPFPLSNDPISARGGSGVSEPPAWADCPSESE